MDTDAIIAWGFLTLQRDGLYKKRKDSKKKRKEKTRGKLKIAVCIVSFFFFESFLLISSSFGSTNWISTFASLS